VMAIRTSGKPNSRRDLRRSSEGGQRSDSRHNEGKERELHDDVWRVS
jgi:hypothetical protein